MTTYVTECEHHVTADFPVTCVHGPLTGTTRTQLGVAYPGVAAEPTCESAGTDE